jgi:hypothetical protein
MREEILAQRLSRLPTINEEGDGIGHRLASERAGQGDSLSVPRAT